MDNTALLEYLTQLEQNNSREWYHAHQKEKKVAMGQFQDIVFELGVLIGEQEGYTVFQKPSELIFRLARDMRIHRDKPPFHPAFRAHFSPYGKTMIPLGYFLCLRPGDRSFLSCGHYVASYREATLCLREHLFRHGDELEEIVAKKAFQKEFTLAGERLKRMPKGYDDSVAHGELLKYKSLYAQSPIPDSVVVDGAALREAVLRKCRAVRPFKDFLNRALEQMSKTAEG